MSTNISTYNSTADDIVLYKVLQSNSDFLQLQEDLNLINEWSDSKHLTFNGQKSKYMILSNKKKLRAEPPVLTIGAAEIERVHEFQYLGVTITSTLSWSEHIHNTARKVRKLLGLLYRQFYGLVNPQQFMKLYSSIVRPHMEYASQVWNPHLKKNIDELENTQKMALRICTRLWDLSYGDLLLNSKILTLAARREYLSLCTFYKIIHNQMFFPPNILNFKKPVSIRSTSCLKGGQTWILCGSKGMHRSGLRG